MHVQVLEYVDTMPLPLPIGLSTTDVKDCPWTKHQVAQAHDFDGVIDDAWPSYQCAHSVCGALTRSPLDKEVDP